jgi:hypothetical protein
MPVFRTAFLKLNAFGTPTKWRIFHDCPIQVVNRSGYSVANYKDRSGYTTTQLENARRKANATGKKPLLRERGPIARSYSDPRNKVLAEYRRKRDGCNRMNTSLTAVRRVEGRV